MKHICPEIKDEELKKFSSRLYVKQFKSKEIIFPPNQHHKEVCFVTSGLIRCFHLDEKLQDRTLWFVTEAEFVTDYPAFLMNEKSKYSFETLEDSSLVFIPKKAINEAYEEFPSIQTYGRRIAEEVVIMEQKRLESFQFKTAKERYIEILEHEANLVNRVPLGHIATRIGISRQSITRIRKQLLLENDTNKSRKP